VIPNPSFSIVEIQLFFLRVTFEFVERVRKSFTEADADNTGYLDVSEFTAFMRQTYFDITDREAQIIFMKV
jgi:Ca2+-binding EF-hand superfamily protein